MVTKAKRRSQPVDVMGADIPPLDQDTRALLPTDVAAYHLNRSPQTLRVWACYDKGPIRPVRVTGRLGWRTTDIRRLVEGG